MGSPVLCIYHDEGNEADYIGDELVDEVRSKLGATPRMESLCVLIESPGGYADSAYRLVKLVREYAADIEVLVPHQAKSAATLVCLGADKILMGFMGELGPLDPQIEDPAGGLSPRSALETFQGMQQLRTYSINTLDAFITFFREEESMDAPHCYRRAEVLFAAVVEPLYNQVDPNELGRSRRYQEASMEYATRVMERWGYASRDAEDIYEIAYELTWGYPEHGFVIDLREAQELGLLAEQLDHEADILCQELLASVAGHTNIVFPSTPQSAGHDVNTKEENNGND